MGTSSLVTLGTYHGERYCGYCGSDDTARSYGFIAPFMSVGTYEAMLNRGWRRSGKYMYKPDLRNTCCKLYAIRLEATKFKSRREHRKDVNRFNRYIKGDDWDNEVKTYTQKLESQRRKEPNTTYKSTKPKPNSEFDTLSVIHSAEYGVLMESPHPDHLKPAHNLTIELDSDTFTSEKYDLYAKYQAIIHHESKHEITPKQFERFLCSSPLREATYYDQETGEQRKTGSFHQLYRVDGELVAFAVLDFLPHTISSVYFIYDPGSMGKFGMGKVSAVREVAMCIEGGYKYYGLGLFASGCEKLRYKGEMQPSELLDPETYIWHPIERYRPFFDRGQTYVSFNNDENTTNGNGASDHVDRHQSTPLDDDSILFGNAPNQGERPYNPHLDPRIVPSLFRANMPGVHSREVIVNSEGFWGKWIFVWENGELKRYWRSEAVGDKIIREEIREMVAILGRLMCEMTIYIQ